MLATTLVNVAFVCCAFATIFTGLRRAWREYNSANRNIVGALCYAAFAATGVYVLLNYGGEPAKILQYGSSIARYMTIYFVGGYLMTMFVCVLEWREIRSFPIKSLRRWFVLELRRLAFRVTIKYVVILGGLLALSDLLWMFSEGF